MSVVSKYVSLKNYIPTGLPKETDFEIKSKDCLLYTSDAADE